MKRVSPAVLAVVVLNLLSSAGAASDASHPLVLQNVHVLPMTGERVIENISVLVRDGRISAISPSDEMRVPEGAILVDGDGAYLLPGLIETHVHLRKRIALDLFLGHGVTTVRNMDGTPQVLDWRDAIAAGEMMGPTIKSGSPFLHRHAKDSPDRFVGSVGDARRQVRRYVDEGYDYIKIAELDDEPFFALMDEARARSIAVVGHIPNYELNLERIFEQRMTSIEHLEELFRVYFDYQADASKIPGFVDLVRRSQVPISTLIRTEVIKNELFEERSDYLNASRIAWIERYSGPKGVEGIRGAIEGIENGDWERRWVDVGFLLKLLAALHESGVVLVPGTDSGGSVLISGLGLHEELSLFYKAGLSPYETLRTATVNAAHVLDLQKYKGTVEVGKDADLVLTKDNPLEILETVASPIGLVVRGVWFEPEDLEAFRARTYADEP